MRAEAKRNHGFESKIGEKPYEYSLISNFLPMLGLLTQSLASVVSSHDIDMGLNEYSLIFASHRPDALFQAEAVTKVGFLLMHLAPSMALRHRSVSLSYPQMFSIQILLSLEVAELRMMTMEPEIV